MLYLTYDNDKHTDGAGAQLQRIISIYLVCKFYKINYYHTGILKLDYQGLECLINNKENKSLLTIYNNLFLIDNIPNTETEIDFDYVFVKPVIHYEEIMHLRNAEKNILFKITYADNLIIRNPEILLESPPSFNWINNKFNYLKIAVHIRRGELLVLDSQRMLPIDYYINIMTYLETLIQTKYKDIKYEFHIFSETVKEDLTVTPSHHGILNRINSNIVVKSNENEFLKLKNFKNVIMHINENPVITLTEMINCNCIIASKSSFSYTSSIINKNALIIFPIFWHNLSSKWISIYDQQNPTNDLKKCEVNIIEKIKELIE